MRQAVRAGAIALAFLASTCFAAAQTSTSPPMSGFAQGQLNLNPAQQQSISRSLSSEQTQQPPAGYQPQVGSKIPASVKTQSLPPELSLQIPQLQTYHYSMMPGHILVIDPKTDMVMEMIAVPATTGSPAR